jgi:TPR repeat protein
MYAEGEGVPKDLARAAEWYRRAADRGLPAAQFNVGLAYAYGFGVEKDEAEAVRWFERAADAGHEMAQKHLGLAYLMGKGIEKDEARALMWLELAAESGDEESRKLLVDLRQAVDQPKQGEAQQLAKAWRERHAQRAPQSARESEPLQGAPSAAAE